MQIEPTTTLKEGGCAVSCNNGLKTECASEKPESNRLNDTKDLVSVSGGSFILSSLPHGGNMATLFVILQRLY